MNRSPTVSVVIPTYNGADLVIEAIDSVLTQTLPPDEIIVVDDGSTDDTRSRLSPYVGRIRYLYKENGGLSSARNAGIRASQGELIAFLDGDDRWLPTKLEKQIRYLEDNPGVDLVHTDFLYWDSNSGAIWHVERSLEAFSGQCYLWFFFHGGMLPSAVAARRRCFAKVGLFDERIPGRRAEDLDQWIRIARHFSFGFVPETLVHYRRHANNLTLDGRQQAESVLYVYQKALRSDPALAALLGNKFVRQHIGGLSFDAAWHSIEHGNFRKARDFLAMALRSVPLSPYLWALWTSTFLPASLRKGLRSLKQRVLPRLGYRWFGLTGK